MTHFLGVDGATGPTYRRYLIGLWNDPRLNGGGLSGKGDLVNMEKALAARPRSVASR
jgi:hypothetical protein